MTATDDLVGSIVAQVLAQLKGRAMVAPPRNGQGGQRGVFSDVNSAVSAAADAQREFERRGLEDRRRAVACIRKICLERAAELGRDELEETKIGRLSAKIEKLK